MAPFDARAARPPVQRAVAIVLAAGESRRRTQNRSARARKAAAHRRDAA